MLAVPQLAYAQEAAPPPEETAERTPNDGEIVVTALRRDTRLQETPLAISATSGETLERSGTTSFTELTRTAPSLRIVDSGPGNRRVLMRGIQSSGEPTVGVYFDETPVSGSVSTSSDAAGTTPDFRLFDVERAEVLRGPQGTLFGSGSMGGTLRVIYEKPKSDRLEAAFNGNMTVPEGGQPGASLDAMLNLPIVDGLLAVRVVGSYNQFAGYVDNVILATDPNAANVPDVDPDPRYKRYDRDINDGRSYGGRVLVRVTPSDRLTLDLGVYHERVETDSSAWRAETAAQLGRRYVTASRARAGNSDKNTIYNATLRYDFDWFTATAVTSYFDRYRTGISDNGDTFNGRDTAAGCRQYLLRNVGTCTTAQLDTYLADTRRIQTSGLYQPNKVKNWVNELRFSSSGDGPFQWTIGGFLEDRDTIVRSTLLIANPATGELPGLGDPSALAYDRTIFDYLNQKAAYVELSYELFDQLTLTAGTRYYNFKKTVGGRIDMGQIHYSSVVTPYQEQTNQEEGFIYKANISWQASPNLLFYAQAAQGFRPGGVNQVIGLPAQFAGYSSDSLWNYELGAKTTLGRGIYFNVAGYRIDWDNLQVSARTSGTGSVFGLIANAGAARIHGIEAEFSANLFEGLSLNANFGYTDAKLSKDQVSAVVVASGRKGNRLAYVPQTTGGLAIEYRTAISGTLDGSFRIDGTHVGSSYSTLSPTDVYRRKIDAYELVNLRFGITPPDENWGVALFVNNLLNDEAISTASASSNSGGFTSVNSAPPRTYGLNLTKRF